MADPKLFRNVEASLLKYCKDIITLDSLSSFKPFNFDTHATINELPDEDLIGIAELGMVDDEKTYEVTVMFVVCTTNDDTYLEKLRQAIDCLFDRLKVGTTAVKVVNMTTGAIIGNMVVERGVSILPVAATKGRPLQSIAVKFGSSLLVPP